MTDTEGTINSVVYPIVTDQNAEVLWRTVQVAEEKDEIWDDWSEGTGETKQETGKGYLWANGFDASSPGALRLSPHYLAHNNTSLTTGYGYFMEDVATAATSISAVDTPASSHSLLPYNGFMQWSHTVNTSSNRILIVGISMGATLPSAHPTVTYGGVALTKLSGIPGEGSNATTTYLYYLVSPLSGANNVIVTNKDLSTVNFACGSISYSGVNQDTPWGTAVTGKGADSTPTITVTSAIGDVVVAVLSAEGISTIAPGAGETEQWDDNLTSITGGGYTQAGAASVVMSPTSTTTDWTLVGASLKPASTTSQSIMWVGDGTNMFRYIYDTTSGPSLAGTQAIASATVGQPAKLSGKWYTGMGNGTFAYRLDDASSDTGWVITTWKAGHLSNFQKGILPTAVRSNTANTNIVDINDISAGGNVGDTWTNDTQKVGDSTTAITAFAEAGGELFVAKEDSLYGFGTESESRNVIPFLSRGKVDSENGKGTIAFGNVIIYPSKHGLWRYIIGRSALAIGVNTLRRWRAPATISIPKGGRHAQAVYVGEYIYILLNEGELSYLLQGRFRQPDDPPGHEIILHPVLTIPLSKGMGVDSLSRLWLKGASTSSADRSIRVIELASDGSLDTTGRKGQASATHTIQFDERNPGRPQDLVQLRRITVDLEGDWDATTSLQFRVYLDNATVTSVGAAITAPGVTTRNWTVGTSDTAYRFRPELQITTNSSYTPLTFNPRILHVIVGIRFPEIIKIVIPADDGALKPYGLTANIAEQNLQRLQNQGVVTFLRPGTTATFNADIMGIADTTYATPTGYSRGIEITARRWVTT